MGAYTPRFIATKIPTELLSPTDILDLTDGGDSILHYHTSDREVSEFQLEAGENLTVGDPVKVSANKVYKATNSDPAIIGINKTTVLNTFPATVIFGGIFVTTGLVAASPYFVDAVGITTTPPVSGYIHRIGFALSSTSLLVNIEEPILLS